METIEIKCPISILEDLKEEVKSNISSNNVKLVTNTLDMAVARLKKHGFIKYTEEVLATTPLTTPEFGNEPIDTDPDQMVMPIL